MAKIKINIKNLPPKPGVYLFKDETGKILYIGKALNLKSRVKNQFQQKTPDKRIASLINKTKKVDYIKTGSEIESLLLEARLIKEYRPFFNVRLKDDKRYLYVGITKEEFPTVCLIRQPENQIGLLAWYGPFPSAYSLKEILRLLRRIFPYRSCKKIPKTPCLYYHLKLCPGMCVEPVEDYNQTISNIKAFLDGKISFLVSDLEKNMKRSAEDLQFEKAAGYKRQIQMIENLLRRFKRHPEEEKIQKQLESLRRLLVRWQGIDPVIIHRLEAFDVANLERKIVAGAMAVFIEGEPDNSLYRQFKIKKKVGGDPQALKEVLERRFKHPEWIFPQVILIDGGKTQVGAGFEVLKKYDMVDQIAVLGLVKKKETIVTPKIKKEKIAGWKLLSLSSRSPALLLLKHARDEAHRFAQRYYKKLYRKVTLASSGPK